MHFFNIGTTWIYFENLRIPYSHRAYMSLPNHIISLYPKVLCLENFNLEGLGSKLSAALAGLHFVQKGIFMFIFILLIF